MKELITVSDKFKKDVIKEEGKIGGLAVILLELVEMKLQQYNIELPATEREDDDHQALIGYDYAELLGQFMDELSSYICE